MNTSIFTLNALVAGSLAFGAPAARADKGHGHGDKGHSHDRSAHAHAADSAAAGAVMGSHDGMTAVYRHLGEMEKELAAGNLDGIHGHDEAIRAAVKDLDKDTTLTADKRKRVQGYVKNVIRISGKLHAAADGKKLDQARKDLPKLMAQVDLLDKQFAHSHKPGAATQDALPGSHDRHQHHQNHPHHAK